MQSTVKRAFPVSPATWNCAAAVSWIQRSRAGAKYLSIENLPFMEVHRLRNKKDGAMNLDVQEIDGACHCRTVRFNVKLKNGLHTARRCTCSYCQLKGAVVVSAAKDGVTVLSGGEALTKYQFNTNAAEHYFCSKCGIYTFHKPRANPDFYGVNAACLEGISPFDFEELPVNDGINHSMDTKDATGPRLAGMLRYFPAE